MRIRCLAAVLALLCLPVATAASGTIDLASPDPVRVEGDLAIDVPGGTGFVRGRGGTFDVVLRGVDGRLTLSTQHSTRTALTQLPQDETRHEVIDLANATLTLTVREEVFSVGASSPEGAFRLRARVGDAGLPVRVDRETPAGVSYPTPAFAPPERIDVSWRRGWLAFGTSTPDRLPMVAFPAMGGGELALSGTHRILLFGGNLTFPSADGTPREERLGSWETQGSVPSSQAAWTVVWRQALLDVTVAEAVVPLVAQWGVAGPEARWSLDGTVRWTRATGEATVAGTRTSFEDADVTLDARALLAVAPPEVDAVGATSYAGEGEVRALRVDGAPVAAPVVSRASVAPAATLTVGALLLVLLTKAGQALLAAGAASLYTRLGPGDVLRHPQRRQIHAVVTAEPGLHQRELHRRMGGAWGPFAFHLRMLEKAGHVRLVRQGVYTLVFPAGAVPGAAVAIPNPVARAVFDAVPTDGSPIPLADLVARVGVSRELVGYHLRGLESRGLLRRVALPGARRGVARTEAAPPPTRSA